MRIDQIDMTQAMGREVWLMPYQRNPHITEGEYPEGYLEKVLSLFPTVKPERIIHCPSGYLAGPGMTVDARRYTADRPKIRADATRLPFPADSFDLFLADPPDPDMPTPEGVKPYDLGAAMVEAYRVLAPGGILGIRSTQMPYPDPKHWRVVYIASVVSGALIDPWLFTALRSLQEGGGPGIELNPWGANGR